jgi:hypothetical protein
MSLIKEKKGGGGCVTEEIPRKNVFFPEVLIAISSVAVFSNSSFSGGSM